MSFEKRIPIYLELGFPEKALAQLKGYVDLLWASNDELNLISRKMTFDELIDNHVIDCLLPLGHFPRSVRRAADFGTGGGLPAVIYACAFPDLIYKVFEKSPKKQEFLNRCREIAPNLEVQGEIPKSLDGIELVTARAFKPLDVILDMSRSYYAGGGKYFLLKGRKEKIDEEAVLARKKFKNLTVRTERLESPVMSVERHVVLIGF